MKKKLKPVIKVQSSELPYIKITIILFITNIIFSILVLLINKTLPPELPILYGYSDGERQLVANGWLILPFIASGAINALNFSIIIFTKNRFLKEVLLATSFVSVIFSVVTIFKVISVVGNF